MKTMISIVSVLATDLAAGVAQAHELLAPHQHPHETSVLPDVGTLGIAALVLALAVIAFTQFRRG